MHLRPTVIQGRMSTELRRQFAQEPWPIVSISGATPHHAQLAEAAGFRLFFHSGSQSAAHVMGLPDAGLMTLTEATENLRRICQSVTIPVIADCDTGFGNPVNTTRAVHDFITAGVAGLFIEDQTFPKRCGFTKGVEVIPIADAAAKYRAAIARRDMLDPDVMILARTDAYNAVNGGMDEVMRRCEAYADAGVDMLVVVGPRTRDEVRRIVDGFPDMPVYVNASSVRPPLSTQDYVDLGVATYNISLSKVAQLMMEEFLRSCHDNHADAFNTFMEGQTQSRLGTFSYLDLTGFPSVVDLERRFLPVEDLAKYDSSAGEYDPAA